MRSLGVITAMILVGPVFVGTPRTASALGFSFGAAASASASGSVVVGSVGGALSVGGLVAGAIVLGGAAVLSDSAPAPAVYAYAPPPVYAPPPAYDGTPAVYAAEREADPMEIGLGLAATSTRVGGVRGSTTDALDGGALLLRFRGEVLELELEIGHEASASSARTDDRLGGALLVHALRGGPLSAYGVLGAGVVETTGWHGGERGFGYGALGVGLAARLGPFSLGGDVRWQARRLLGDRGGDVRLAGEGSSAIYQPEKERAIEARLVGVLYF